MFSRLFCFIYRIQSVKYFLPLSLHFIDYFSAHILCLSCVHRTPNAIAIRTEWMASESDVIFLFQEIISNRLRTPSRTFLQANARSRSITLARKRTDNK